MDVVDTLSNQIAAQTNKSDLKVLVGDMNRMKRKCLERYNYNVAGVNIKNEFKGIPVSEVLRMSYNDVYLVRGRSDVIWMGKIR